MAPEQLEGKEADARADVFAFGAVLYEMLTGRKAFDGGSAAAVMAAVLNAEPAPVARDPAAGASFTRAARFKSVLQRIRMIAGRAPAILPTSCDGLRRGRCGRLVRPKRMQEHRRPLRFGYVAALVAIVAAVAAWAGWSMSSSRESSPSRAVIRFAVVPSASVPIGGFDISPDGTLSSTREDHKGATACSSGASINSATSPIAGTEGANAPFFSPDGQWVAFFSGGKLLKVNVQTTAAPILLCDDLGDGLLLNGAAWLQDGTIIFSRMEKGLQRVSTEGGEPMPLTSLSQTPQEFDHHSPLLLPGGEALLFTASREQWPFQRCGPALGVGGTQGPHRVCVRCHLCAVWPLVVCQKPNTSGGPFRRKTAGSHGAGGDCHGGRRGRS